MTALALQSLSFSTKVLEKVGTFLKKTLQGIMIGWMVARQTQANRHIADLLMRSGEYRKGEHNYYTLLADLNQKTIQNIHKEFNND